MKGEKRLFLSFMSVRDLSIPQGACSSRTYAIADTSAQPPINRQVGNTHFIHTQSNLSSFFNSSTSKNMADKCGSCDCADKSQCG